MKTITFGMLFLFVAAFGLAGCHTMAGAGQDVQDAGQGVHNSAEKHAPDNDQ